MEDRDRNRREGRCVRIRPCRAPWHCALGKPAPHTQPVGLAASRSSSTHSATHCQDPQSSLAAAPLPNCRYLQLPRAGTALPRGLARFHCSLSAARRRHHGPGASVSCVRSCRLCASRVYCLLLLSSPSQGQPAAGLSLSGAVPFAVQSSRSPLGPRFPASSLHAIAVSNCRPPCPGALLKVVAAELLPASSLLACVVVQPTRGLLAALATALARTAATPNVQRALCLHRPLTLSMSHPNSSPLSSASLHAILSTKSCTPCDPSP